MKTKIKDRMKQLREMSELELNEEVKALKEEIFNIRFQMATSHSGDFTRIKYNKRMIARIKTIMTDKKFQETC